jgi:tetratricopeptide (TPR) repeat protein
VDPRTLVSRIEASGSDSITRALLHEHRGLPGLSAAYFSRVLELFAADHNALSRLASSAPLVLRYGDDRALGYRTLGVTERVAGRWSQSARAFIRAGDCADDPKDRLAYKTGAVDSLAKAGRVDDAVQLGAELTRGLEALGERALAARVRMNLSHALLARGRYEEARDSLEGLPEVLEEAGFVVEAASARMARSTSHLYGGDPTVAESEAQATIEQATELEMPFLADLARINLAHVALLRGRGDESLETLLALRDRMVDAPVDLARVLELLGETHAALNLWPEALDAFREALSVGAFAALHVGHLHLGIGQVLLAMGRYDDAKREFSEARRRYRRIGNSGWEAAAATGQAEAWLELGNLRRAAMSAEQAVQLARLSGSPYHTVRALIARVATGYDERLLREAERTVERFGYAGVTWRIHALRAARKAGASRLAHYRKMFEAILQERSNTSSLTSRTTYLRDKSSALRDYLEVLLAKPSAARVAEALSVVERSRSVALLDEVLAAQAAALDPQVLASLEGLRRELNETRPPDASGTGSRLLAGSTGDMAKFQRRWLEATHRLVHDSQQLSGTTREDTAVFISAGRTLHAVVGGRSYALPIDSRDLERRLKWLQFELLAPMTDRSADADDALCAIEDVAKALIGPWADRLPDVRGVCPDSKLWRVPWTACCDLMGAADTFEVRLHPGLQGGGHLPLATDAPPALWIATHRDLPYAELEAEAFCARYPQARVFRTAAEVRRCLPNARFGILHVVSHAKHRWSNPMFSSLEFSDGPVFAAEVARSGLRADLVTLSACDTASMSVTSQEEPEGLARAFLARGARCVVGSAWPLDDEAAGKLYGAFYRHIREGHSVGRSLQSSRNEVREWRAHPYFWASPVLYAGYQP